MRAPRILGLVSEPSAARVYSSQTTSVFVAPVSRCGFTAEPPVVSAWSLDATRVPSGLISTAWMLFAPPAALAMYARTKCAPSQATLE